MKKVSFGYISAAIIGIFLLSTVPSPWNPSAHFPKKIKSLHPLEAELAAGSNPGPAITATATGRRASGPDPSF